MLEAHSWYSFDGGCIAPEALPAIAKKGGWPALALCDDEGLYGMLAFQQASKAVGVRPILGSRFPRLHGLIAVARSSQGQQELSQLCTIAHLGALPEKCHESVVQRQGTRAVLERLASCEDLHLLIPSESAFHLVKESLKNFPRKRIHLLLNPRQNRHEANKLWSIARDRKLSYLPASPLWTVSEKDDQLSQIRRAIYHNTLLHKFLNEGHSRRGQIPWTIDHVLEPFRQMPEVRQHMDRFFDDCCLELQTGHLHLPKLHHQGNDRNELMERCEGAITKLYPAPAPFSRFPGSTKPEANSLENAREVLRQELQQIDAMGFSGYFLVVHEISKLASSMHMPFIGRGSAANSLVAYCLGITQVDPIRYRLHFERFLNPERVNPPDIDIDFSWRDRNRLLKKVYDVFGHSHCAMISTHVRFGARGAFAEMGRIQGVPKKDLAFIRSQIPESFREVMSDSFHESPEKLQEFGSKKSKPLPPLLQQWMPHLQRLQHMPRHLGIHPSGLLIAPFPIAKFIPLQRSAKGFAVTQLDMHPVEALGLVKIDLLAQRGLGVHSDLMHLEKERGHSPPPQDMNTIEADPEVQKLLSRGQSMGCFYVESPGMRSLLRKLRCWRYDDLIAASSIIRPGVAESGMMDRYIRRHLRCSQMEPNSEVPITYAHPLLEELLGDSYGVMIYQEDVMKVAHTLAGMSLGEADLMRRAMSGKAPRATLEALEARFLSGCKTRGISAALALEIWEQIASFAGYAFCKAHSASFAQLSMRSAWFKAHRPAEFMAAVLNNGGGFYSREAYIQEARRMGIHILSPCLIRGQRFCEGESVSNAGRSFEKENAPLGSTLDSTLGSTLRTTLCSAPTPPWIRIGFGSVASLSQSLIARLQEATEKKQVDRTLVKPTLQWLIETMAADTRECESLILSGACDGFLPDVDPRDARPRLLWELRLRAKGTHGPKGETDLFDDPCVTTESSGRWSHIDRWMHEREVLGFGLGQHPLDLYDFSDLNVATCPAEELEKHVGQRVLIIAWRVCTKHIRTRKSKRNMAFLSLEDQKCSFEAVLFPDCFDRLRVFMHMRKPLLVEGLVKLEAGVPMVEVQHMARCGKLSEGSMRDHVA